MQKGLSKAYAAQFEPWWALARQIEFHTSNPSLSVLDPTMPWNAVLLAGIRGLHTVALWVVIYMCVVGGPPYSGHVGVCSLEAPQQGQPLHAELRSSPIHRVVRERPPLPPILGCSSAWSCPYLWGALVSAVPITTPVCGTSCRTVTKNARKPCDATRFVEGISRLCVGSCS